MGATNLRFFFSLKLTFFGETGAKIAFQLYLSFGSTNFLTFAIFYIVDCLGPNVFWTCDVESEVTLFFSVGCQCANVSLSYS